MITCEKVVELLQDMLEDNLAPETRESLKKHLHDCPPCLRFFESYKKTTSLCKQTLRREAPKELGDRLMCFLREKTKQGG